MFIEKLLENVEDKISAEIAKVLKDKHDLFGTYYKDNKIVVDKKKPDYKIDLPKYGKILVQVEKGPIKTVTAYKFNYIYE